LKQYDKALVWLEKIDPATLEPSLRASALFLRGQAYRGVGNLPAAVAQFTGASEIESPLRPRAKLELGRALAESGNLAQAIEATRAAATSGDPAVAPEAARVAGDLSYKAGQYAPAIDYYRVVLTNYTTSPQVSPAALGMMWAMLAMKQHPQIITAFEQYKAAMTPEDRVVAWYLTGSAYQDAGEHDKAAGLFNALVMGSSGSAVEDKAMYKLAYSQVELGQYEQAQQTIDRLREKHPDSPLVIDGQFLLASMDAKRADAASGIRRISALIEQGANQPQHARALLLRAKLQETSGQLDAAARDYTAYLSLAGAPATARQTDVEGIQEASLRLVDIEYRQGRFDNAVKVATQLLERKEITTTVRQQTLYRQALGYIKLNKLAEAEHALTTLLSLSPAGSLGAEASYYRGLTRMAMRKPDPAVADLQLAAGQATLDKALQINALRLVSIRQRELRQTQAIVATIQQLEKLAGIGGLSAGELLWIARYEQDRQDHKAAIRYLKPIIARQVDAATDQRAWALRMTGRSLRQLGDLPAAINAYREAVALPHADPGRTRLELAKALRQAGKTNEAMDEYHELMNSELSAVAAEALSQMADVHIAGAQASAATNDTAGSKLQHEEARKLLKRLVLLYSFPELSPLPQVSYLRLAEVESQLGDAKAAQATLQEAVEKFPDSPYAQYAKALGFILQKQKLGDALFILRKLKEQPLDGPLGPMVDERIKALEATS
ncbi:MAG: tetratricopeptide repeat protein, partial [Burkholderiales bacterium]|nr:tetratricopeptide repeat protein [Burkholderiales bacterium]